MDLFLRILYLKTSGLRSSEIEAVAMIVITIQISGDVSPPSLNIAMSVEQHYSKQRLCEYSEHRLNVGLSNTPLHVPLSGSYKTSSKAVANRDNIYNFIMIYEKGSWKD